ncbi:FusB/FusC family EF-G-binding protein [Paenibacillus koleovorans]|uniref:FusB/FusC family EF-G-binding protein n=1 Tax=Paenibacillus koleovorans TaxID=121608 RepID=UPI000FDC8103|nr:FusB/FusC family EF-G-binding protein [Paenibacillus koleovorans]
MNHPFIRNHQFNAMRKITQQLQLATQSVSDPRVLASVRDHAQAQLAEVLPGAADVQKAHLERVAGLRTAEEFEEFLRTIESWRRPFPSVTEAQLKKLFPKVKKLKVPDLEAVDPHRVTYLSWTDIASGKMFLVYPLDGQWVGIEGRCTPVGRQGVCFLCNKGGEVGLFTAITKSRPAGASPDYYKAIGNYMCLHGDVCNKNITDVKVLEQFLHELVD